MLAPHFFRKPAASTASITPSSSRIGMVAGSSDSPTCSRGNRSRSSSRTRAPLRASSVAVVLPPGPPPMTIASNTGSAVTSVEQPRGA